MTPSSSSSSTGSNSSTGSKKLPGNSYVELHLSKLARNPAQSFQRSVLGSLVAPSSNKAEKPVSIRRPSVESMYPITTNAPAARYNSLPENMLLLEAQRDSPFSVVVSVPSEEHIQGSSMPHPGGMQSTPHVSSSNDTSISSEGRPGDPMSLTWPRTNLTFAGGGSTGLSSMPPISSKGPVQINADPLGVAGGKYIHTR